MEDLDKIKGFNRIMLDLDKVKQMDPGSLDKIKQWTMADIDKVKQ